MFSDVKKISGRSRKSFSFGSGTKATDAPTTKKTKTRALFGSVIPYSRARVVDSSLAQTIANQYQMIFGPQRLNRISSKLVGKYRTSGAVNPKASLFHSRFAELQDLEQRFQYNPEEEESLEEEAAETMLSGGKKKKSRRKSRRRSRR